MGKKVGPKLIPEVNIGLVGHVAHGKTTLVYALTGKLTLTHSEELKRGITIRLGYADATIYECKKGHRITSKKCPICLSPAKPKRTVSFVDAPGHETLMATVLTGAALMDGAILVIAANEPCPQPQTREHLTALEVVGIRNIVIVQNKVDLVEEAKARENYEQIRDFVKGTVLEDAPIIPISAQQGVGIEKVVEAIDERIPTPARELGKPFRMLVARSFDVNRPGTEPERLRGGVLGGSIVQGEVRVGDEVEISPGILRKGKYEPILTKVSGLQKAGYDLEEAGPGGLLGLLTELDPCLTKADGMVGNLVGAPGELPDVLHEMRFGVHLLERVVGTKEFGKVEPIKPRETLMINVGTARTIGEVMSVKGDEVEVKLRIPVCAEAGDRIALSRQIMRRWRLIGFGIIG
jgi:translation initiation factor 2 subunit 3